MNEPLRTTDLSLAAYLVCKGVELSKIDRVGNKGTFVFDDPDDSLINEYDIGRASVEPIAFHAAIRQLTTACRR